MTVLEGMNLVILFGAGLAAVSIFTSLISFRIGAPLLLVFLLLGLGVGEDGLGLEFDNAAVAYFIGSVALVDPSTRGLLAEVHARLHLGTHKIGLRRLHGKQTLPLTWHYTFGSSQPPTQKTCGFQSLLLTQTVEDRHEGWSFVPRR